MDANLKAVVRIIKILDRAAYGTIPKARLDSYQALLDKLNKGYRNGAKGAVNAFVLDELQAMLWYMRDDNEKANNHLKTALESKPKSKNFVSKAARVWEIDYREKYNIESSILQAQKHVENTQNDHKELYASRNTSAHPESHINYGKTFAAPRLGQADTTKYRVRKFRLSTSPVKLVGVFIVIALLTIGLFGIQVAPFYAFDGAVWLDNGPKYISNEDIYYRTLQINSPLEEKIKNEIEKSTKYCDEVSNGFCKQKTGTYAHKTLKTPAVAYRPGTPDRKEIIGYCTICRDGTYSPSCAIGRGACSWHGGVAQYNAPKYITIPGRPEVQARAAVYSYVTKSYKDSPSYTKPVAPSIEEIVKFTR